MASSSINFQFTAAQLRAGIQEDTTQSKIDLGYLFPRMTAVQYMSAIVSELFISSEGSPSMTLNLGTQADYNVLFPNGQGVILTQAGQQFAMTSPDNSTLYDTQRVTHATLQLSEGFSVANITDGSVNIYVNVVTLDQFATTHLESMSFIAFKTANLHSVGVFGNDGETYSCGVSGALSMYGSGTIADGKAEFQINSMFTDNTEIFVTRTDEADTEFTVRKVVS